MKKLLKNQNGAVILVIIIVLVIATVGGGATFLGVRMLVSGDGNFLQPFEDLGWIDSKDEEDEKNDKSEKSDESDKTETKKESGNSSKYLIDESKLSSQSKKSEIEHYYGKIDMSEEATDDEFSEYADLMKAGINIYAKDGKAVEIAFGFDISEFCEKLYNEYKEELSEEGISSSKDLQDMMMELVETMFEEVMSISEEYSEYIKTYSDSEKGTFQLYVTKEGFESLYEVYDIEENEEDVDVFIDALEDEFNCKINLVED